MGKLLEIARAAPVPSLEAKNRRAQAVKTEDGKAVRRPGAIAEGRVKRVRLNPLPESVYFADDHADINDVPAEAVIFWPDELQDLVTGGDALLPLLYAAKKHFDPHGRTEAEPGTADAGNEEDRD